MFRLAVVRRVLMCLALLLLVAQGQAITAPARPAPTLPPTTAPAHAQSAGPSWLQTMPSGAKVAIIRVEGVIYDFTLKSISRRCDRAIQSGATVLVIEIDSPGGLLNSALKISQYIKSLPVPTLAWVRNEAYSAGVLASAAADALIMSPIARAGDCAPIAQGQNLAPTERAKVLSPLLAEFRESATLHGYDYAIFQAMCVLDVELYLIEHRDTGQRRIVHQADYAVMVHAIDPNAAIRQASGSNQLLSTIFGTPPSSNAQAGANAPSVASLANMPVGTLASAADRGQWREVQKLHDGRTLLTVNQNEALEIGLSRATVRDEAELQKFLSAVSVTRFDPTWSEEIASWLTWTPIRFALTIIFLLGLVIELHFTGLIFPGVIALIALVLLLTAPFVIGLAETWHLVVFVLGFVALIIEIFITPGFGLLGIAGIVMMFVGLVLAVVPSTNGLPAHEMNALLQQSVIWTLMGVFTSGFGVYAISKHARQIPMFNRLVLRNPPPTPTPAQVLGSGPDAPPAVVSGDEVIGRGKIQVGDAGTALTTLRPSGRATIAGHAIDVVTPGQWIEPNTPVRVIEVQGNRIVVDNLPA